MMGHNLDMIQRAIDEADKKLSGVALSHNDYMVIRGEYEHKIEETRADTVWLMESYQRLIATIDSLEAEIDKLHSEILGKNRIIFQVKKALE